MAKVARAASPVEPRSSGPAGPTPAGGGGNYFRGVWDELRKVVWPTATELWHMTGVVVATVLIFAVLVGAADYLLGLAVKPLYSGPSTTPAATAPARPAQPAPMAPSSSVSTQQPSPSK